MREIIKIPRSYHLQLCLFMVGLFCVVEIGHTQNLNNELSVNADIMVQGLVARVVPIKDKIVEWLDPKPITYQDDAEKLKNFKQYLPKY